ncbi:MAG: TatD family hydrolase [Candidatus Micrarchaeota archaeon]|nr:TatD family hydrolase [Candidatus Micrarchaeota archaeon]MCX8154532.1 TatD family hydrolase [Candidatus Micrarchaeota archaeon]
MNVLIDVHTHVYNYSGSVKTIKVSYSYENFDRADLVGISPQNYRDYRFDLERYVEGKLGVGEIGLDYYWVKREEDRSMQRSVFMHQLSVAEKSGFVEIHCREAYDDVLEILSTYNIKTVIFHFFSGTLDHYRKIIDHGWFISIPPRESASRKKAIQYSIDYILCETDSPYICESPDRVIDSYMMISKIRSEPIDIIIEKIWENYHKLKI